jgi:hypothetical protein
MGYNKSRRPILTPSGSESIIAGAGGVTYDTTEYDTGKVWIDGRAIYGKVIDDSASGTYSTGSNLIAHGLTLSAGTGNTDLIINMTGWLDRSENNEKLPINYGSTAGQAWSVASSISDTNIKISVGTNWTGGETTSLSGAYISIEYVKFA